MAAFPGRIVCPSGRTAFTRHAGKLALLMLCMLSACGEPPRFYEIKIDVTVDGERVQFTRYLKCIHRPARGMFPSPAGLGWSMPKGSLIAKRLSSGAGLVWWSLFPCRRKAFEPWNIPDAPRNLIWFDNAEKPQQVESYHNSNYFKQAGARIIWHGGTGRRVSKAIPSDPDVEVPWLQTETPLMVAYFARVLNRDIWARDPLLKKKLEPIGAPIQLYVGQIGSKDKRYFRLSEGYLMPMEINSKNETINLDTKKTFLDGIIVYYRNTVQQKTNPFQVKYNFTIDGHYVSNSWDKNIYYPKTKQLIIIQKRILSAYVIKSGLQ